MVNALCGFTSVYTHCWFSHMSAVVGVLTQALSVPSLLRLSLSPQGITGHTLLGSRRVEPQAEAELKRVRVEPASVV